MEIITSSSHNRATSSMLLNPSAWPHYKFCSSVNSYLLVLFKIGLNEFPTTPIIGFRMMEPITLQDVVRWSTTRSEISNTSCSWVMVRKLLGRLNSPLDLTSRRVLSHKVKIEINRTFIYEHLKALNVKKPIAFIKFQPRDTPKSKVWSTSVQDMRQKRQQERHVK